MKLLILVFISLLIVRSPDARAQCADTCKIRLDTAQELLTVLGVDYHQAISRESKTTLLEKLTAWQSGPVTKAEKPTKVEGLGDNFSWLEPGWKERVARMPSFKAEFVKTPPNVYGVLENAPAGTAAAVIPNPDHALLSLGGSIDTSELFLNVANRVSLCQSRIDTNDGTIDPNKKSAPDRDKCQKAEYLKAIRPKDYIERYASATVINVNVVQIPNYESGIVLLPQTPAAQQRWTYTVTGSITPALLFRSAADLKAVAAYASNKLNLVQPSSVLPQKECASAIQKKPVITRECLIRMAIGPMAQRVALTVLPRVDVKAYTAVDFAKSGTAAFVQLPGGNKPLYDVAFTWDMRNLFPSTQNRADALAAVRSLQHATETPTVPKAPPKEEPQNIKLWRQSVAGLYCALANEVEMTNNDVFWQHFIQVVTTPPIDPHESVHD